MTEHSSKCESAEISAPIEMDYFEFAEKYKPIQNPFDDNVSFSGAMLETYGDEFAYVQKIAAKEPERIWTIIDGEDDLEIISGMHFVNRFGYIITEVACPADEPVYVIDDD